MLHHNNGKGNILYIQIQIYGTGSGIWCGVRQENSIEIALRVTIWNDHMCRQIKRRMRLKVLHATLNEKLIYCQWENGDENIYKVKGERSIFRCKARWSEQGEKPTKYFLNLEKRNNNIKIVTELKSRMIKFYWMKRRF